MSLRNHSQPQQQQQQQLPSLSKLSHVLEIGLKYSPRSATDIAGPTDKELRRDDKPASIQRERSKDGADSDQEEEVFLSIPMLPQLFLVGNNYPADPTDKKPMLTRITRSQIFNLPDQRTVLFLSPLDGQGFVAHMMQLPSDDWKFELYAFCKTPIDGLVPIPGLKDPSRNKDHPYKYGIIEN